MHKITIGDFGQALSYTLLDHTQCLPIARPEVVQDNCNYCLDNLLELRFLFIAHNVELSLRHINTHERYTGEEKKKDDILGSFGAFYPNDQSECLLCISLSQ